MTCPVCGSEAKVTGLQDEAVRVDCLECTPFGMSKEFRKMMPGKVFDLVKTRLAIQTAPTRDSLPMLTVLDVKVFQSPAA